MAEKSQIEAIKDLRARTGAGMMDCKHALEDNDYDIEKAIDQLRLKGIAKAAKRADRVAAEGLTKAVVCESCGHAVIVEVNCETDFVAGSDTFIKLVDDVCPLLLKENPENIEAAREVTQDLFTDAAVALGEKLTLRRFEVLEKAADEEFFSYSHMQGKITVLAKFKGASEEDQKGLAMHIAANAPLYITLEDVPAEAREHEHSIAVEEVKNDEKLQNKPEKVKEMIIGKKVEKVLGNSTLSLQSYLLDDSKTVAQFCEEKGIKIVEFVRYGVGEGISK